MYDLGEQHFDAREQQVEMRPSCVALEITRRDEPADAALVNRKDEAVRRKKLQDVRYGCILRNDRGGIEGV